LLPLQYPGTICAISHPFAIIGRDLITLGRKDLQPAHYFAANGDVPAQDLFKE